MQLSQPFVRLPYTFEVEQLQREVSQFDVSQWMAHPNRMDGNSAVPLVSVDGGDNDEFAGPMQATPHLQRCGYIKQVMASFDEVIARSRLMRLAAGCKVNPHVDFNYHWYSRVRIHIPVITNPQVIFHCGDEQVHMQAGECWIFDSWRGHQVVNESDEDRVHLVIDTSGSSRFWKLVQSMSGKGGEEFEFSHLPYSPGNTIELRTERYNVAPVMAPGELEALAKELIADVKANPENDQEMLRYYEALLTELAKDWRALWSQFGTQADGLVEYANLLKSIADKLAPHPRALVVSSNNVGINPIIMQRIIRAALYTKK